MEQDAVLCSKAYSVGRAGGGLDEKERVVLLLIQYVRNADQAVVTDTDLPGKWEGGKAS